MTVSGQHSISLLESVLSAQAARVDIGVAVLKKAQDVDRDQGAAMIQLLEQSVIEPGEGRPLLDTHA